MTTRKFHYLLAIVFITGVFATGCKDSNEDKPSLTAIETAITQDAESQDAFTDKVDQDVDGIADKTESNNFSAQKAGNECYTITVDKPDTTSFPKVITVVFNCTDTINGTKIRKTGEVKIYIERMDGNGSWKNRVKRTVVLNKLKMANDSMSFTISGERVMKRLSMKSGVNADSSELRAVVKDSIRSNFTCKIQYGSDSMEVTRVVKRIRESKIHFKRYSVTANQVVYKIFRPIPFKDTVSVTGSVTGRNAGAQSYIRNITSPLVFNFCSSWPFNPMISSGTIEFTAGDETPFTISYSANGCKTMITATRGDKTSTVERSLNRKFHKWW